jgi:hypothetical protein
VYGCLSKESLEFTELVYLDKHQYDFCLISKTLNSQKNLCEHVRSCIVLEEKGNTPKDFWRNGFMPKGYAQCVICMKLQQKGKACHEHQKTHDLINKKGYIWQGKSCGILSQITNKN